MKSLSHAVTLLAVLICTLMSHEARANGLNAQTLNPSASDHKASAPIAFTLHLELHLPTGKSLQFGTDGAYYLFCTDTAILVRSYRSRSRKRSSVTAGLNSLPKASN
ncbi:MAG: hypothetical protein JST80_09445 [Bdellovibrionales bacterium]|nr:hypothetical protein [Bdellovibrionales bacterium]